MNAPTYAAAALEYLERGWSPLSLPSGQKKDPLAGWTGYRGRYVETSDDVEVQAKAHPNGNVCLRMPETVLGIDVDAYDGKVGAETLADAEARLGFLPDTWWSSSREAPSGIRFFRVPAGLKWCDVGLHVETISWHHRYAVVAPSRNPDNAGMAYTWTGPDGQPCQAPVVEGLPDLPDKWVDALTKGAAAACLPEDIVTIDGDLAGRRIEGTLGRLREALKGDRNNTLNWAAYVVGGLWARVPEADQTGDLDADVLRNTIEAVARDIGLTGREVATTLDSGWDAGVADPMRATADRDSSAQLAPTLGGQPRAQGPLAVRLREHVEDHYDVFPAGDDGRIFAQPRDGGRAELLSGAFIIRATKGLGTSAGSLSAAATEAAKVLAAYAEASPPRVLALRVHHEHRRVVLDLAQQGTSRCVVITPQGWSIEDAPPPGVIFQAAGRALPDPERGGDVDDLRALLRWSEDDPRWPLVKGWLPCALLANIPRRCWGSSAHRAQRSPRPGVSSSAYSTPSLRACSAAASARTAPTTRRRPSAPTSSPGTTSRSSPAMGPNCSLGWSPGT